MRLIAVAGEALGHADFVPAYGSGSCSLTWRKDLFKKSDLKYQGLLSGVLSYYTGGAVAKNSARCDAKGALEGEGSNSGVFAVSPQGEVIEHREAAWATDVVGDRLGALRCSRTVQQQFDSAAAGGS